MCSAFFRPTSSRAKFHKVCWAQTCDSIERCPTARSSRRSRDREECPNRKWGIRFPVESQLYHSDAKRFLESHSHPFQPSAGGSIREMPDRLRPCTRNQQKKIADAVRFPFLLRSLRRRKQLVRRGRLLSLVWREPGSRRSAEKWK